MDYLSRLEAALEADHLYDEMASDVRELVEEVKRLRGEISRRIPHDNISRILEQSEWIAEGVGFYECPCSAHQTLNDFNRHIARLEGRLKEIANRCQVVLGDPQHDWKWTKIMQQILDKALAPAQEGGDVV